MRKSCCNILRRFWHICFYGIHKNSHLLFYLRSIIRYCIPKSICRLQLQRKLAAFYKLNSSEQEYIQKRVDYYCKFNDEIFLPEDAPTLSKFAYRQKESYVHDYVNSTYFFDAYEYTRFFDTDITHQLKILFVRPYPRCDLRKFITERHALFKCITITF